MTSLTAERLARARTLLYVPGHRPDRFAKATASGADFVVLDLEDAVAPHLKAVARENVRRWLSDGGIGLVRLNGTESPWFEHDLDELGDIVSAVILPMAETQSQVAKLHDRLPLDSSIVALLETAAGILNAHEICAAPGVVRTIFGSMDLANELDVDHTDRAALAYARSQVVLASAACGLAAPIDGVSTWIVDEKAVAADAEDARALGFGGKSCAHPRQVPIVREVFTPSAEDIQRAREIASAAGGGSATVIGGQLIGKPVVERARRLLTAETIQG